MIINATKKTILLLSIVSLNNSVSGMSFVNTMVGTIKDTTSRVLISEKGRIAATVLVPMVLTGCVVLAKNPEPIFSLLGKIPALDEKVALSGSMVIGMSATYVLSDKFRPEEQFKLSQRNCIEVEKHRIIKNKKTLQKFIAGQKEVQFNEKKSITWQEFISNNFSDEVNVSLYPNTKAANELCDLERRLKVEDQRLEWIKNAGTAWTVVKDDKDVDSIVMVSEARAQVQEDILFIEGLRGKIVRSPEYIKEQKINPAIKKNQHTEGQITFSTQIAAFVPMFIQPVATFSMILLQIFLNRIGSSYQVFG